MEELKEAVFALKADGAPVPDGFPILFYQRYWNVINVDMLQLIDYFFVGNTKLHSLNHSWLILIPKRDSPSGIRDFRPICLLNCAYKIISKILANRLASVIDFLVDSSQSAFIKGQSILDNIVCVQEALLNIKKERLEAFLLKLDFEKAFDNLN